MALKSQEKGKQPKKKSRHHQRRPGNLLAEYNRRQRKHVWLETHIWHAKRFKIAEQWGYKIPLHPNDKSVRASYRAMASECLMQDLSYYQCVEVCGKQERIIEAMKHLTSTDAGLTMAAKQYLNGSREGHLVLYKYDKYPWNAIGPVMFLWQQHIKPRAKDITTKLWVWSHPACAGQVLTEIFNACFLVGSTELRDVKPTSNENTNIKDEKPKVPSENDSSEAKHEFVVAVLTEQLVRFRLTGPKSHALLASALELCEWGITKDRLGHRWWQRYDSDEESRNKLNEQNALWRRMNCVTSPSVVVSGSVMGLVVKDPRLGLPVRKSSVDMASESLYKGPVTGEAILANCTASSAFSPMWDTAVRQQVKQSKIPEKELNRLRSKMVVPGSKLDLGEETSRIPVLVTQQPGTRGDGRCGLTNFGCGYDLLIPAGWSMAFWIALVYRGARVGGSRELATCSREQGLPHFPCDFPDTNAGQCHSEEQRRTGEEKYEKYPPAKRPNYEKLGMASPFGGDWVRLVDEWSSEVKRLAKDLRTFLGDGNLEEQLSYNVDERLNDSAKVVEVQSVVDENDRTTTTSNCSSSGQFFVVRTNSVRRYLQQIIQALQPKSSVKNNKLLTDKELSGHLGYLTKNLVSYSRSLVCLDLLILFKGCPLTNGVIYSPTKDDLRALEKDKHYGGPVEQVHKGKKVKDGEETASRNLIGGCTRKAIGYISSGQYSFARGQGAAVGFCAFPGFCELVFMIFREKCRPLVLVRNTTSFQYRFASFVVV